MAFPLLQLVTRLSINAIIICKDFGVLGIQSQNFHLGGPVDDWLYPTWLYELPLLKFIPRIRNLYLLDKAFSWLFLSPHSLKSSNWAGIHCLSFIVWILRLTSQPSDSKVSQYILWRLITWITKQLLQMQ